MNIGRFVLVTAAFCALSTSEASARHHHGLRSNGNAGGAASGGVATNHLAKSSAAYGSEAEDADISDENAARPISRISKRNFGTGASAGPETGVAPESEAGRNQSLRPVPGGVNANGADGPIDTSVAVDRGRTPRDAKHNKGGSPIGAAIADIKRRLQGRTGSTVVPKTSGLRPHFYNHPEKFPAKGATGVTRNAIGATIERGAAAVPRASSGPQEPAAAVSTTRSAPRGRLTLPALPMAPREPGGVPLAVPGPAINGTNLVRPGTSHGLLGGPAKVAEGINGSNVRMRRP
jgi:hypothetical protein